MTEMYIFEWYGVKFEAIVEFVTTIPRIYVDTYATSNFCSSRVINFFCALCKV